VRIEVNGESLDVPAPLNLTDLVQHLELAPERLAIELNRRVVRRADWQETTLNEGDRVEIVHFVGGGNESDK
jgi:thiamine biosynthesis protein ThiS